MNYVLSAENLTKRYGRNLALSGMSISIKPGEVHALVGANGAGKSTLVNILSGAITPDEGRIRIGEWEGQRLTPREARDLGLATIHQDPELAPTLTLLENVILGREVTYGRTVLHTRPQRETVRGCLDRVGLGRSLGTRASALSSAEQQLLGIARALYGQARVVIMDEPTAALGTLEREKLFGVVRDLQADGIGVLYISHHLDEIFLLADRVTVARDGTRVLEAATKSLTEEEMVDAMVGHEVAPLDRQDRTLGDVVLAVDQLGQDERMSGISFELRAGETLGVTGLVGSGRSRLAKLLFGVEKPTAGSMTLFGERYTPREPADAIRRGVGFVPEDRAKDALLPFLPSPQNITAARIPTRGGFGIRLRSERRSAQKWIEKFRVKPASLRAVPAQMSGGNQQKLVIARWLHSRSRLIILDEPCRGVDIDARQQILTAVRDLAEEGVAIIYITQDIDELQEIADRSIVLRFGRVAGELAAEDTTEARVIPLSMGVKSAASKTEVTAR